MNFLARRRGPIVNLASMAHRNTILANSGLFANSFQQRLYHSIAKSGVEATAGETPVLVYDSVEFEPFNKASEASNGNLAAWDGALSATGFKSKFYSLVPF